MLFSGLPWEKFSFIFWLHWMCTMVSLNLSSMSPCRQNKTGPVFWPGEEMANLEDSRPLPTMTNAAETPASSSQHHLWPYHKTWHEESAMTSLEEKGTWWWIAPCPSSPAQCVVVVWDVRNQPPPKAWRVAMATGSSVWWEFRRSGIHTSNSSPTSFAASCVVSSYLTNPEPLSHPFSVDA